MNIIKFLIGLLAILLVLWLVQGTFASATARVEKVYWCHCAESGVCNTLHLPLAALENAGHVSANGNPLHAGDQAGACVEPTNTPEPTVEVSPTEMPDYCEEEGYQPYGPCEAEITPEVTVAPTRSIVHPSATPFHPTPTAFHPTPTVHYQPYVEQKAKPGSKGA